MNRFTNTLVNVTYCSGIVILIVGLYDNKMRLMNVDDTQWIILSIVLGIIFPL